jgi:ABC-type transporter Mla subunit MlaD
MSDLFKEYHRLTTGTTAERKAGKKEAEDIAQQINDLAKEMNHYVVENRKNQGDVKGR